MTTKRLKVRPSKRKKSLKHDERLEDKIMAMEGDLGARRHDFGMMQQDAMEQLARVAILIEDFQEKYLDRGAGHPRELNSLIANYRRLYRDVFGDANKRKPPQQEDAPRLEDYVPHLKEVSHET